MDAKNLRIARVTTGNFNANDPKQVTEALVAMYNDLYDLVTQINTNTTGISDTSGTQALIDASFQAVNWKSSVKVATVSNITLSGAQTIDGVSIVAGNRVLVKNQDTGANNGIFLCASGAWTRATDANTAAEIEGATVRVLGGTVNGGSVWQLDTTSITLGTTALVFSAVPGYSVATGEKRVVQLVTQSSTDAPTAVVPRNDFSGVTLTWAYVSSGVFTCTASSAIFTAGKTTVLFSLPVLGLISYSAVVTSTTVITITTSLNANVATVLTSVATNALMSNIRMEIIVSN